MFCGKGDTKKEHSIKFCSIPKTVFTSHHRYERTGKIRQYGRNVTYLNCLYPHNHFISEMGESIDYLHVTLVDVKLM